MIPIKISLNEIVEELLKYHEKTAWLGLGIIKEVKEKYNNINIIYDDKCNRKKFDVNYDIKDKRPYSESSVYDLINRVLWNTYQSLEEDPNIKDLSQVPIIIRTIKVKGYDIFEVTFRGIKKIDENLFILENVPRGQRDRIGTKEFKDILNKNNWKYELENNSFRLFFK